MYSLCTDSELYAYYEVKASSYYKHANTFPQNNFRILSKYLHSASKHPKKKNEKNL